MLKEKCQTLYSVSNISCISYICSRRRCRCCCCRCCYYYCSKQCGRKRRKKLCLMDTARMKKRRLCEDCLWRWMSKGETQKRLKWIGYEVKKCFSFGFGTLFFFRCHSHVEHVFPFLFERLCELYAYIDDVSGDKQNIPNSIEMEQPANHCRFTTFFSLIQIQSSFLLTVFSIQLVLNSF